MKIRELDRLLDLLRRWHEDHPDEGAIRDNVSELRHHIADEIEERTAAGGGGS